MEIKSGKTVKNLEVFFFKATTSAFRSEFLFQFGQILFNLARTFVAHHEKIFVPAFIKVSIDHPI